MACLFFFISLNLIKSPNTLLLGKLPFTSEIVLAAGPSALKSTVSTLVSVLKEMNVHVKKRVKKKHPVVTGNVL